LHKSFRTNSASVKRHFVVGTEEDTHTGSLREDLRAKLHKNSREGRKAQMTKERKNDNPSYEGLHKFIKNRS
jgi:hypothetical protein